jgi:hypothetical protein
VLKALWESETWITEECVPEIKMNPGIEQRAGVAVAASAGKLQRRQKAILANHGE